jgi:PPM family protein phosphatase
MESHLAARLREPVRPESAAFVREAEYSSGPVLLDAAVVSSRGGFHAINEDGCSALDGGAPLFVVADGVSLGAMASQASSELVSRLHEILEHVAVDARALHAAVLDADREVRRCIASRTDAAGAATVALCAGTGTSLSRWLIAWVGDCRVYRVSPKHGGSAQLLTRDDTYRHLREQPPHGASLDDPARMVGNGAVDAPNVRTVDLGRDEMLLLCSDGVHKHAEPSDIARLLRGTVPLVARCARLVEFVRERGSRDDATVLVVHRTARRPRRFVRLFTLATLIALAAGALLWFAADRVTAQRLPDTIFLHTAMGQP